MTEERSKLRGFASMSPERRRQIASRGGKNVPPERRVYSTNRQLASDAGRVGGRRSSKSRSQQADSLQDSN